MDKEIFDRKIDEWTSLSARVEDHDCFCECYSCMRFLQLGDELLEMEFTDEIVDAIIEENKELAVSEESIERVRQKVSQKLSGEKQPLENAVADDFNSS